MDFARSPSRVEADGDAHRHIGPTPWFERQRIHQSSTVLAEDCSIRDHGMRKGHTPLFQLALPYAGLFTWDIGRGETLIDANQILFIQAAKDFVEHQPIVEIGHSGIILTWQPEATDELLHMARAAGTSIDTDIAIPTSVALRRLLQCWLAISDGAGADALVRDELAIATFERAARLTRRSRPTPSALIKRVKLMLQELATEPLSLQQLAETLGVTPVYLTQAFSRAEGMPLYRYQLHLRLGRAMAELPTTDDITTLALDLGFSSHSHFTTAFKSFAKQTPSQFREAFRRRSFATSLGLSPGNSSRTPMLNQAA